MKIKYYLTDYELLKLFSQISTHNDFNNLVKILPLNFKISETEICNKLWKFIDLNILKLNNHRKLEKGELYEKYISQSNN